MPNSISGQPTPLPVTGNGTAGSPDSAVLSVQGVASGTPIPVSFSGGGALGVTQSTSPWVVAGNLTHNSAAPGSQNVGVLPAVASSAAPSYSAGDQVLLSTDLSGALRVNVSSISGSNPAAGVVGSPTPSSASYTAFRNDAEGTTVGVSRFNPLPVVDLTRYVDGFTPPTGMAQGSFGSSISGSSIVSNNPSGPLNVVAGQTILITLQSGATSPGYATSVTDNLGNTYTLAVQDHNATAGIYEELYYCISANSTFANGGTLQVTATYANSSGPGSMSVAIYPGILALDVTAHATGNSTAPNSGTVATTNANDILIGVIFGANALTVGSGYTSRVNFGNSILEDKIVNSTGINSASATMASGQWIALLAAFKIQSEPIGTVVMGRASSGAVHAIALDASNNVQVNVQNTVTVSGTVAVTQSTSPWVVSGTVTANAGTGTFTVGGTVTVSPTTGAFSHALNQDGSGNVGVNIQNTPSVTPVPSAATGLAPTFATVGTSSAQILASNSSRKGLVLVNTSTNTISLAFGANAAVLNSGITLIGGGAFNMDQYQFSTAAINAIASSASSNIAIQEFN